MSFNQVPSLQVPMSLELPQEHQARRHSYGWRRRGRPWRVPLRWCRGRAPCGHGGRSNGRPDGRNETGASGNAERSTCRRGGRTDAGSARLGPSISSSSDPPTARASGRLTGFVRPSVFPPSGHTFGPCRITSFSPPTSWWFGSAPSATSC